MGNAVALPTACIEMAAMQSEPDMARKITTAYLEPVAALAGKPGCEGLNLPS